MASSTLINRSVARPEVSKEGTARAGALLGLAAVACLLAGVGHLAVVVENPGDWWQYVAFFLVTGVGQVACAGLLVRRPAPWVLLSGIWGNVAILGMYLYTRTWGVPVGPAVRHQEPAGTLDMAVALSEVAVVVLLCAALAGRTRRIVINLVGLLGVGLWIGRMTGLIL